MGDYIEELKNYCIKNQTSPPKYETTNASGSYLSKVTIGHGISTDGIGSTEEEAMKWAARLLLSKAGDKSIDELAQSLKQISIDENESLSNGLNAPKVIRVSNTNPVTMTNPIGYLNEFCQKRGLKFPVFEAPVKSGEDHCPSFVIKCTLTIDGTDIVGEGKSRTVKESKKASAEHVIRQMRENESKNSKQNQNLTPDDSEKLFDYLSEYFSNNSELDIYIESYEENDCYKKLEKIAPIIGCDIDCFERNNNAVILRLIIIQLSQNNILITSFGSSDEGLEASKKIAANKAILLLKALNNGNQF